MLRSTAVSLGLICILAMLTACASPAPSGGLPTAACDAAARVATTDPNRNERRLDPLLIRCSSVADLEAVGARYGIALVGPDIVAVARLRCREGAPAGPGTLCPAVLATDPSQQPAAG